MISSMKKSLLLVLLIMTLGVTGIQAQNQSFKSGLSFKALALDYQTFNGGDFGDFTAYHPGFEVGFHRYLGRGLSLNVPLKVGVVQSHENIEHLHKSIINLDAKVNYEFLGTNKKISPYILAGIGGSTETQGDINAQIPVGLGIKINVNPRASINWQSEYRKSLADDRDNLHHGLGFIYLLGKKPMKEIKEEEKEMDDNDSDGDGLTDDIDLCPQDPGPKELNGCPDSDADGIADYEDKCPQTAGPVESRGCPDSDGDGVSDNEDECPNMAGTIANNGCPANEDDNDGDGIRNAIDDCPDQAGPVSNRGCPTGTDPPGDRDGDGVNDNQDRCPDQRGSVTTAGCPDGDGDGVSDLDDKCPRTPGTVANDGCPETLDSDNDGILDQDDRCPNQFGPAAYNGCPDTDGDGVDDSRDNCPDIRGTIDNNGCPRTTTAPPVVTQPAPSTPAPTTGVFITQEERDLLDIAMRAIQFETSRDILTRESLQYLNQIGDLIQRYPEYRVIISGHTDSTGGAARNLRLSTDRAKACYEYMINAGVPPERLEYVGFGETRPIADNGSVRGRQLNRRVEFKLLRIN